MSSGKYPKGQHPNSKKNLTYHEGRPTIYDTPKRSREVTVTDEGWQGVKTIAKNLGYSVSELLEKIGRGDIKVNTEGDRP